MPHDAMCADFYGQTAEPMAGLGQYSEWDRFDIIERLQPLLASGWKMEPTTGKITPVLAIPMKSPWWNHKPAKQKKCTLWHRVMFTHWGFVPQGCQECWKIVVRPRTLRELFQLREVERLLDLASKCGIEVRSYTPAHYGGYFYTNSLDEGRQVYKIVRDAVSEAISPEVGVILKRGCTEMELRPGVPSILWKVTREQIELEEYIEERVAADPMLESGLPDYLINRLKKRWVAWAFSNNDQTYLDYTGGQPLHTPPVVYHEGDIDVIKRDMQVARMTTTGMDPQAAVAAYDKMRGAMAEVGANEVQMGAVLGYAGKNPLHSMEIPAELRGEEDQTT